MDKSQIVIQVDREALRQFRAACILRGTTPTKEIAQLLAQRLASWQEEERRRLGVRQDTDCTPTRR